MMNKLSIAFFAAAMLSMNAWAQSTVTVHGSQSATYELDNLDNVTLGTKSTVNKANGKVTTYDAESVDSITFGQWPTLSNQWSLDNQVTAVTTVGVLEAGNNTTYSFYDENGVAPFVVTIPTADFGKQLDLASAEGVVVKMNGVALEGYNKGALKISKNKFGTSVIVAYTATNGDNRVRASYAGTFGTEYATSSTWKINQQQGTLKNLFRYNQSGATTLIYGTAENETTLKQLSKSGYSVVMRLANNKLGTDVNLATDSNDYVVTVYDNSTYKAVDVSTISGTVKMVTEGTINGQVYYHLDGVVNDSIPVYADYYGKTIDVDDIEDVVPEEPWRNGCWITNSITGNPTYSQEGFDKVYMKETTTAGKTRQTFYFLRNSDNLYSQGYPKFIFSPIDSIANKGEFKCPNSPADCWEFTKTSDIDINGPSTSAYAEYMNIPKDGKIMINYDPENKTIEMMLKCTDSLMGVNVKFYYKGTYVTEY